jgi:hypothetical protein
MAWNPNSWQNIRQNDSPASLQALRTLTGFRWLSMRWQADWFLQTSQDDAQITRRTTSLAAEEVHSTGDGDLLGALMHGRSIGQSGPGYVTPRWQKR